MVSLRFSFSSLAVLAVVLLSTTLVVGIAQEDELMSSSSNNNLTSSEEEFAGDDDIVDLDVTNSNNSTESETEEEFDVTETALDVDIFEEDLAVVGNSTIREDIGVDEEILDEEAPTFEEDISNITMAPTEAPTSTVVPPQQQAATPAITLGPKPTTTSAAPVSAADSAEPGSTDPVMVISGATTKISSSLIVGVIVSVAVAASMIL